MLPNVIYPSIANPKPQALSIIREPKLIEVRKPELVIRTTYGEAIKEWRREYATWKCDHDPVIQEQLSQLKVADVIVNKSNYPIEQLGLNFLQKWHDSLIYVKNFYRHNKSYTSLEELEELVDDSELQIFQPGVLCAPYDHSQTCLPISKAMYCRFINLRGIPVSYWKAEGGWIIQYPLPRFMVLDLDGNKTTDLFRQLYGWSFKTEEAVEALGLPTPLFIVVNPLTGNVHIVYEISYTDNEWYNQKTVIRKYEEVRKKFSWLIGADTDYCGHNIRSPFTLIGHHKDEPTKPTRRRTRLDPTVDTTFHKSIWYPPRSYQLNELDNLITERLGDRQPDYNELLLTGDNQADIQYHTKANIQYHADIQNPENIYHNENNALLAFIRTVAFRRYEAFIGKPLSSFINHLLPTAMEWNDKLTRRETPKQVRHTTKSAARFVRRHYVSKSSEVQKSRGKRSQEKWHETHTKKPRPSRRQQGLQQRRCSNCGADISHMRATARACTDECRKATHYKKLKNAKNSKSPG